VNTFVWTVIAGGCSVADKVEITRNEIENINAGTSMPVCSNTVTLQADAAGPGEIGTWSSSDADIRFDNSTTSLNATAEVSNLKTGANVLTWTLTKGGCSRSDDLTVQNNFFTVNPGADQTVCTTTTTLGAFPLAADETGVWTNVSGTGTVVTPSNDPKSQVTGLGNAAPVIFRWTVT